ncbi:MAG: carbon-nitrogen hydrolase family protein [Bacteroidota bacterium]
MKKSIRVALIQHAPVFLDLQGSLKKARQLLSEAAAGGAELVVFGETWLTGYPAWLDHCPDIAMWGHGPTQEVFSMTYEQAVEVPGPVTEELGAMARAAGVGMVMGIHEKIPTGSMYNSVLTFGADGRLLNHHRKLVPTYTEKLLHQHGDGQGLKVVETQGVRVGASICWEHWMPHTRQSLHLQAEDIHIALWPNVHEMHQVASRHYAFEGRCYVLAIGQMLPVKAIPPILKLKPEIADKPEHLLLWGGSCVVGPDGFYVLEPQIGVEDIFYADLDLNRIPQEKMTLDVAGHYNRPDVFSFEVNTERRG